MTEPAPIVWRLHLASPPAAVFAALSTDAGPERFWSERSVTDGGGTDLTMTTSGYHRDDREELLAGWLNVLLPLKAAVDHAMDLRNHDPSRTWRDGFVEQ